MRALRMSGEIREVDERLRAHFARRRATATGEEGLKCELVNHPPATLAEYPFLVSDEWEPSPGLSQNGRGDLVFTDGRGRYAVVEVKWMGAHGSGRSQRKRRNRKRNKVIEQAQSYATHILATRSDAVEVRMMTFTNDPVGGGLRDLGVMTPTSADGP